MDPDDLAALNLLGRPDPQSQDPWNDADQKPLHQLYAEALRQYGVDRGDPSPPPAAGPGLDPDLSPKPMHQVWADALHAYRPPGGATPPDAYSGSGAPQPGTDDSPGQPGLVLVSSKYPAVPPASRSPGPRPSGAVPRPSGSQPQLIEGRDPIAPSAGDLIGNFEDFISGQEYDHAANVRSHMQGLMKTNQPRIVQGAFADVNGAMAPADMQVFDDGQHTAFVKLPSFGPEGFSVYEMRDGPKGRQWTSGDGQWHDLRTDPPFIRPLNKWGR